MRWTSALAIYFIMWFFCLFLVLPFHARRSGGDGAAVAGEDRGAPPQFAIGRAAAQVTLVSAALFSLYYLNYVFGWLTAEDISFMSGPPPR